MIVHCALLILLSPQASAWLEPSLLSSSTTPRQHGSKSRTVRFGAPSVDSQHLPNLERRGFLQLGGAAVLAASGALPVVAASGGDTTEPLTLERCIYLILRVQEGTQQVMSELRFTCHRLSVCPPHSP